MVDFFYNDTSFFEAGTVYVIYENGRNDQDYSTFHLEQGENGDWMFRNLFTYLRPDGNVHKDIVLNLGNMSITEIIADDKVQGCYVNHYKLNSETLFLDGQDLTFNITPYEKNPSQKFSSITFHRRA